MPAAQYPFIDVAVHRAVRDRFARGEALVLFSADMQSVLWANGAGARHFGKASIYDLLEQGPARQDLSFRQLAATASQLSQNGDSRALVLRIASGFRSVTVQAQVELVEIRRGEPVVLFSLPSAPAKSTADLAADLLSGFDDPDTHMAILDAEGLQIAASPGFSGLGLTASAARGFIARADAEPSHVLKRPLPTGRGHLPAAIGKVCDAPAMYLVLAVETILGNFGPDDEDQEQSAAEPAPLEMMDDVVADERGTTTTRTDIEPAPEPLGEFVSEPPSETVAETIVTGPDEEAPGPAEAEPEPAYRQVEQPAPVYPRPSKPQSAPLSTPAPASMTAAPASSPFRFQRDGRATRFVWKIDANGHFTEVSNEFAAAVGPRSAAIEGIAFVDLAALFNLDPDGKLGELLNKRDTWSGKTIYWPVQGTALRVPVDLAALPTYTRNREFDGFRGFGVVRIADAVEDPLQTGLSLDEQGPSPDSQGAADYETAAEKDAAGVDEPLAATESVETVSEQHGPAAELDDGFLPETTRTEEAEGRRRDEPPALYIAETHNRRASDKVIQLDDRRGKNRDGLSPSEEAAFREIARKLEPIEPRQAETIDSAPSSTTAKVETETGSNPPADARDSDGVEAPSGQRSAEPDEAEASVATDETASSPPARVVRLEPPEGFTPPVHHEFGLSAEIVDMMPVALLVHVAERLIHGNPELFKLTGYDSLEALADAGGLDALLQREELEGAEGRNSRMVVVRADDSLVPVSARLQSVRWAHSSALMLSLVPVEMAETIPDRDEAGNEARVDGGPAVTAADEQADELARLRIETEEMRSILETATDGVVIIGAEGDIRSMNRSASALFNYDGEELRGKPFVMLFAHESQRAILDYLAGLAGHGVASVLNDGREVIGREASGGFLPLFMTIGSLSSSNGYCAVIRDITQWKRTEEELRGAKRAAETANAHKSDFLARVSHEIRTPLNAIIGFADIMASEHFGPIGHPRYSEYAGDIVRSGRHVLDIVNDLLDISKIEAGEMDLDFTAVGLNETVSQAVSIVQPQANGQRVIIRTALSQAVPSVVADLRSVKQIVLNILANAIRFTPAGGQIIVSTAYEPNGSVVLRIRDTGVGMSRAELEQAMKPFRQVSTGARPRGEGTGLGLPLTKAMVDANRATFSISSTPNEGTLVEVTFPSPRVLAD